MWPSQETASRMYDFANLGLIVCLGFGVVATILIVWMGNVKEGYLKLELGNSIARAETAKSEAAQATERTQKIEQQNMQLRKDLETATTESRIRQTELAKEQTKLAEEQRKTAEAQREAAIAQLALKKHLDQVAEHQRPRSLSLEQRQHLTEALKSSPKGPVDIECVLGDGEGLAFATEIDDLLKSSGWTTTGVSQGVFTPSNPIGFFIIIHNAKTAPSYAAFCERRFKRAPFLPEWNDAILLEGIDLRYISKLRGFTLSFFPYHRHGYIDFPPARSGFACEVDSNSVFGICLDRFDHQVKLVGAVDLARHAP